MKKFGVMVLVLLFAASFAFADESVYAPAVNAPYPDLDRDITIPADAPRWSPRSNELDIIGDTVIVGTTWWESQHNGTVSRMIDFKADHNGNPTAFMVWTDLQSQGGTRRVSFNRVTWDGDAYEVEEPTGYGVNGGTRAGYADMAFDHANGRTFPSYHVIMTTGADAEPAVAGELDILPGVFSQFIAPSRDDIDQPVIWPHAAYGFHDDEHIIHMCSSEQRPDDDLAGAMRILYARMSYDPMANSFAMATDDGEQVLITEDGENIAVDVAVSYTSDRVAIGQTVGRFFTIGEDPGGTGTTQYNNDIYVWVSEDGGNTWDDPINVTNFIGPDAGLLPDSLAADRDTLRGYCDVNVYFDHNDVLHVAFTATHFYAFEGYIRPSEGGIWHWDEQNMEATLVADGLYTNFRGGGRLDPGAWQRNVQRPSMYHDPATNILWLVYQKYAEEGDTLDCSEALFPNGDIYVTASCPNPDYYGRLWAQGVNITNTKWTQSDPAPTGESMSEREPSIALYNEGAYLHTFYVLDTDAGFTEQDEGGYTECPAVYHRVAKQALIDEFENVGEWLPNLPLHVDEVEGCAYWEDDQDYEWGDGGFFRGFAAGEEETLLPGEFELAQNFPNPFNPTTHIAFNLQKRGQVRLAVYDVLGREVATLVNRSMEMGAHSVVFDGSDLASGVYFYRLESGDFSVTQKMVLMK